MPELAPFNAEHLIPRFVGVSAAAAPDAPPTMTIEDVTAGFRAPCVADIKMGTQTWQPGCSAAYRARKLAQDAQCTTAAYGFRFSGVCFPDATYGHDFGWHALADAQMLACLRAVLQCVPAPRWAAAVDAVGVALMLRLTEQGRVAAARAHVACLHAFHRACFDALAQRLRALVDSHIASLRAATPASLAPSGTPLAAAPHYVTRRYAELVAALLSIARPDDYVGDDCDDDEGGDEDGEGHDKEHEDKGGDSKDTTAAATVAAAACTGTTATMSVVCEKLPELRDEMESLLHRLCAALPDRDKQSVFLINNYSLVLDIFAEHGLTDGDASGSCTAEGAGAPAPGGDTVGCSDTEHFRAQLLAAVQAFRDAQLITVPVFKRLVLFAAESDPRQRESPESLAREFAGSWEHGVQRLRTTVLDCFTNFKVAKRIYDSFTDHIVQQYLVLADAIRSSPVLAGSCAQYLVDVATLRDGIRRLGGVLEAGLLSR